MQNAFLAVLKTKWQLATTYYYFSFLWFILGYLSSRQRRTIQPYMLQAPAPTVRGVAHAIHLKMKKQQLSSKFLEQSAAAHSSSPSLCSALNRPEKKIFDHNLLLYTVNNYRISFGRKSCLIQIRVGEIKWISGLCRFLYLCCTVLNLVFVIFVYKELVFGKLPTAIFFSYNTLW